MYPPLQFDTVATVAMVTAYPQSWIITSLFETIKNNEAANLTPHYGIFKPKNFHVFTIYILHSCSESWCIGKDCIYTCMGTSYDGKLRKPCKKTQIAPRGYSFLMLNVIHNPAKLYGNDPHMLDSWYSWSCFENCQGKAIINQWMLTVLMASQPGIASHMNQTLFDILGTFVVLRLAI